MPVCPSCNKEILQDQDPCPYCGTVIVWDEVQQPGEAPVEPNAPRFVKCLDCQVMMEELKNVNFRLGHPVEAWRLFFMRDSAFGIETFPFDLYVCPKCKQVRFFATKPEQQD